jgi:trk system potassium uptake protein
MYIAIAGGGLTAEYIARRLIGEGNNLVIVEKDGPRCRELEDELDAMILHGNASSVTTWQRAGLERADMLIALTDSDDANIMACLCANVQAPRAVKAVRLRSPEHELLHQMLRDNGIRLDRVVYPEIDVATRICRVLRVPGVSEIRHFAGGRIKVFGMTIERDSWLVNKTLADVEQALPAPTLTVPMIARDQEVIIGHSATQFKYGDHIYVATTEAALDQSLAFMGIEQQSPVRQVFIVGGQLGRAVAAMLENDGVRIKLFEKDPLICEQLSAQLKNTLVINADGTDQQTLLRENIEGVDAFLALSEDDDDANLITALLARRLGASKLVALINRIDYLPLARRLGINTTVSLRVKAADAILEFIRKGGVYSVRTLHEVGAEAIELVAPDHASYLGRPLRQLGLPPEMTVAARVSPQGEPAILHGGDVLHAGDKVILFATLSGLHRIESSFLASVQP